MILFFCGAQRSGSHWQRQTVVEALKQKGIPFTDIGVGDEEPVFHRHELKKAKDLLRSLDKPGENFFICKGHWGGVREKKILLSLSNVRIFFIWRDPRDAIISHYYYGINNHQRQCRDFDDFYWNQGGRFQLIRLSLYFHNWGNIRDERVVHTDFSGLKENFEDSAAKMTGSIGLSGVDYAALKEAVSIKASRKKHNDPKGIFYRRGTVGEHKEVINGKTLADVNRIAVFKAGPERLLYELKAGAGHLPLVRYAVSKALEKVRGKMF